MLQGFSQHFLRCLSLFAMSYASLTSAALMGDLNTSERLLNIQSNSNNPEALAKLLPIVHCSFTPSKYERILLTQIRNINTPIEAYRSASRKISNILVSKVVECLPAKSVEISSPVAPCKGEVLDDQIELVSVMRSGDAFLEAFMDHFPNAHVSKLLIQRNDKAEPVFFYKKFSGTIASGHPVVITEPMIATGGTTDMTIALLKEMGVKEENIIIASLFVVPEGLLLLNEKYPKLKVVMASMDEKLNEKKYIVPGCGDFGDRFFGTQH